MNYAVTLVLCIATLLLWGAWGFFGKLALANDMPPLLVLLLESIVALGLVIFIVLIRIGIPEASKGPWSVYGLISGSALAVGLLTYYLALNRSAVSFVVVVTSAYPLIALLLNALLLKEKLTLLQYVGAGLVVIGVGLLVATNAP